MSYASLTTVIDHENPSNPPYTILEGASSTETEPLAIINDLADQLGAVVVCQSVVHDGQRGRHRHVRRDAHRHPVAGVVDSDPPSVSLFRTRSCRSSCGLLLAGCGRRDRVHPEERSS